MAFSQGDKITASGLNSINAMVYKTYTTEAWGWIPDIKWYCHRPSGAKLCQLTCASSFFGGIALRIARVDASNNVLNWIHQDNLSGIFTTTLNYNSVGVGWYRIWATEGSHINSGSSWYIYAGQTDCTQGKKLTLYEDPMSGGNRCAGTKLTASVLNSGLAGTING